MIPRYTRPEMGAVWSDEARMRHWLRIEVLACEAWARLGRIPQEDMDAIRSRASFSVDRVNDLERVTNHDVAAFVQCVSESVGPAGRTIRWPPTPPASGSPPGHTPSRPPSGAGRSAARSARITTTSAAGR